MRRCGLIAAAVAMVLAPLSAPAAEQSARRAGTGDAKQEAKKPNPCAANGPGFTMLPGTTTCVRIGGAVEGDLSVGRGAVPNLGIK